MNSADQQVVIRIAQQVAGEMLRNANRGTGGNALPIPAMRVGTSDSSASLGDTVQVRIDGDFVAVPVVNATGFALAGGDRVLVTWVPPHGVYATNMLSGSESGEWTPAFSGPSASNGNTAAHGYYVRTGRHVRAWGHATLHSGGSLGTACQIAGLPWPAAYREGHTWVKGMLHCYDASTGTRYLGHWDVHEGDSYGSMYVQNVFAAPGQVFTVPVSTTQPVAQQDGDDFQFEIEYEID